MTRKDRIEQLKKELEVVANGPVTFVASKGMSEEAQEEFLLEILAYHTAPATARRDATTPRRARRQSPSTTQH